MKRFRIGLAILLLAVGACVAGLSRGLSPASGLARFSVLSQKGNATMVQNQVTTAPQSVTIPPQVLSTLQAARTAYSLQMLLPTAVPPQYQLSKISRYSNAAPQMENLVITYQTADGQYLTIYQGLIGTSHQQMPNANKGATTVQGKQALWTRGQLTRSGSDPQNPFQWKPGPLRLSWQTVQVGSNPAVYAGYTLETDTLSLDQLTAIANSVQPYQST